jgi:uncharacterized protein
MLRIGNKLISKEVAFADNIFSKGFGLMFKSRVDKPLIFPFEEEKLIPLHMFFVFTPIDVLFLDRNKKIIEIKDNFKPFTYYSPKNKAKYVIELSPGSVKENKIKKGSIAIF